MSTNAAVFPEQLFPKEKAVADPTLLNAMCNEYAIQMSIVSKYVQNYQRLAILTPIFIGKQDIFDYICQDIQTLVRNKEDNNASSVVVISRTELKEQAFIDRIQKELKDLQCVFYFGNEKSVRQMCAILNKLKAHERLKVVLLFNGQGVQN